MISPAAVGFRSTRGHGPVDLAAALGHGPAPDGGLYLPGTLPRLPDPPLGGSLPDAARWCLEPFLVPPLSRDELDGLLQAALDFPVPLVDLDGTTRVLELGHGPSGAFKDVGARVLARLLSRLVPAADGTRTVLVATSGDTGGAVARAFQGLDGFRVVVLFPLGRVSAVQRRVFTAAGGNVRALAVEGPFDACQALARELFSREDVQARHGLTSANSLNLGRLLPQMAYYVHAAATLRVQGAPPPLFVVPSGNLGNLTAGLMAARCGLDTAGFVAAVNANDTFARYLAGDEVGEEATVSTLSNAMDVGRPSNLERLRSLFGDDRRALGRAVEAHTVTDDETRRWMARVHVEHGYLADPHTAVGFGALAAARAAGEHGDATAVVLSTAHPGKFPQVVREVTGVEPPAPPGLADQDGAREQFDTVPPQADALVDLLDAWGP